MYRDSRARVFAEAHPLLSSCLMQRAQTPGERKKNVHGNQHKKQRQETTPKTLQTAVLLFCVCAGGTKGESPHFFDRCGKSMQYTMLSPWFPVLIAASHRSLALVAATRFFPSRCRFAALQHTVNHPPLQTQTYKRQTPFLPQCYSIPAGGSLSLRRCRGARASGDRPSQYRGTRKSQALPASASPSRRCPCRATCPRAT